MAGAKKFVIGASGFLCSHVTGQLVDRGDDVRVLIRPTSSTKAIEELNVEYHYGDIFDDAAVRTAMAGCDDVFYCVVDTRAWLRDPRRCFAPTSTAVIGRQPPAKQVADYACLPQTRDRRSKHVG
jgi:nucleoside-diphosphate-sugar epimerase